MSCDTIEVRRPRVRGLEERIESSVLPLFRRRTEQIGELLPQLYLHGLAQGDFELALRDLPGEGAAFQKEPLGRLGTLLTVSLLPSVTAGLLGWTAFQGPRIALEAMSILPLTFVLVAVLGAAYRIKELRQLLWKVP